MSLFSKVYQSIANVILEVSDIEEDELSPASTFEEVDIDSIDFIELGLMIKKTFNLAIDGTLFETGELVSIQDLCEHIMGQLPAEATA